MSGQKANFHAYLPNFERYRDIWWRYRRAALAQSNVDRRVCHVGLHNKIQKVFSGAQSPNDSATPPKYAQADAQLWAIERIWESCFLSPDCPFDAHTIWQYGLFTPISMIAEAKFVIGSNDRHPIYTRAWSLTVAAPTNLFRYSHQCWGSMTLPQQMLVVEAVAAWVDSLVKSHTEYEMSERPDWRSDLAFDVFMAINAAYTANKKLPEAEPTSSNIDASTHEHVRACAHLFSTSITHSLNGWCKNFVTPFGEELRRRGRNVQLERQFLVDIDLNPCVNGDEVNPMTVFETKETLIREAALLQRIAQHASERELAVAKLKAEGKNRDEIALQLGVRVEDVKNDLASIKDLAERLKAGKKIRKRRKI